MQRVRFHVLMALVLGLFSMAGLARAAPRWPAARGKPLRGMPLERDLRGIAGAPDGRDCLLPSFRGTVDRVVSRLEAQGVEPAGTGKRGSGRYLQGFRFDHTKQQVIKSYNIVGVHRGSGDHREAVVVMAHLDGITGREKAGEGIKRYWGANDNASGVAAVLYTSEVLARLARQGKRPRRDVLFVITSGEEAGLIGAEAFVRFTKQLGGQKIVGAVNFDSIGWGSPDQIAVYGGSSGRQAWANPVFRRAMKLDTRGKLPQVKAGHKQERNYFRSSDQHALAAGGIPAVLYAAKINDDMHTPRDRFSRIDMATVKAASRHGLRLVVDLADAPRLKGKTLPRPELKNFARWGPLKPARVD